MTIVFIPTFFASLAAIFIYRHRMQRMTKQHVARIQDFWRRYVCADEDEKPKPQGSDIFDLNVSIRWLRARKLYESIVSNITRKELARYESQFNPANR